MNQTWCHPNSFRFDFAPHAYLSSARTITTVSAIVFIACFPVALWGQGLQEQLENVSLESLAQEAMLQGDAHRGAIAFHLPQMACAKCHSVGVQRNLASENQLGPDLSQLGSRTPKIRDEDLVESVISPSKSIRKGYESIAVVTGDGDIEVGLMVEHTPERVVMRKVDGNGELKTFTDDEIEEARLLSTSVMPAGLVNQLNSKQQFLDLIRYLIEIRDGGKERAAALQPSAAQMVFTIPEYERHLDHAGIIAGWDPDAKNRGEAIYKRVCANCHGTHDQLGSLPTSLRFAEGKFKNGSDPLSMYRTLTHGFGLMTPQTWMVPTQKYDVIHYIREEYLRTHNPSQLTTIDEAYFESLPSGDTRGPAPSAIVPWSAMDYGPSLTHTYQIPGDTHNFAYKGIAVRLDPGAGGVSRGRHWMVFDTDTLRVAAAWNGSGYENGNFIDWQGIQFDGTHGVHPKIVGDIAFANSTGPGWASPENRTFVDDRRVEGRDGRRYGPLPRNWGKFRGMYHHGQDVVFSYTVGETEILESPRLMSRDQNSPVFLRTFNIGPRQQELVLEVAEHPSKASQLTTIDAQGEIVRLTPPADNAASPTAFELDGSTFLEIPTGDAFDLTGSDFTIAARLRTRNDGTIWALTQPGPKWIPDGQTFFIRDGHLCFDIGWVGAVSGKTKINDAKWHDVAMTWQASTKQVQLFIDGKLDAQGKLAAKAPLKDGVVRIGFTSPDFPRPKTYFEGDLQSVHFYQARLPLGIARERNPNLEADNLVAAWEPADGMRDLTGNGHDATLHRGQTKASMKSRALVAGIAPAGTGAEWLSQAGRLRLKIPAGREPLRFTIWQPSSVEREPMPNPEAFAKSFTGLEVPDADRDLETLTHGGPPRWPQKITTQVMAGSDDRAFGIDVLSSPDSNPWLAQTRFSGLDFFEDGRIAICSWDGDVWVVSENGSELTWQRIASGLFQPLGLKIVDGRIYVTCRDQLAVLHDLNADGETDFYECFNNDHQVTEHFHEFAMGLQVDEAGNFYYAKSGQHGLAAVVPHHGTLLQVSPNGSHTKILANGFRAANGVCLNPDGSFVVTDQEGFWNPKNRINWVTLSEDGKPKFYGNMLGYHDVTDKSDDAMEPPLCWITNAFDRSPGELLWVDSPRWGPLNGSLLNLSYGYGKVFLVPHERVGGLMQGGMIELPIPAFPTGVMRGRFHPSDGHLYACGMFAWAGNATQPGGFYRLRATGKPIHLPIELHATRSGMKLQFPQALDRASVRRANAKVETWSLKRTANYGSKHYDERELEIQEVRLSDDGKTVELIIPEIKPTWCMAIHYAFESAGGVPVQGTIHNTIHRLGE